MNTTVGVSSFRASISKYMDLCDEVPLVIRKHNKIYILMTQEHYVDLINKIKLPNIVQMPPVVQTIVHFKSISR